MLRVLSDTGIDLSTDFGADADLDGSIDRSGLRSEEGNYQGAVRGGGPLVYMVADDGRISLR